MFWHHTQAQEKLLPNGRKSIPLLINSLLCVHKTYLLFYVAVRAMGGQVPFQDALAARLELIKPSQQDIARCLQEHPLRLTPRVDDFIQKLHAKNIPVYLVSGGFRQVTNRHRLCVSLSQAHAHMLSLSMLQHTANPSL